MVKRRQYNVHTAYLADEATIPCKWCFNHGGELEIDSTVETVSRTCIYARSSIISSHAAGACARARAILHQHDDKNISTSIFQIYGIGCIASARGGRCVLYMDSHFRPKMIFHYYIMILHQRWSLMHQDYSGTTISSISCSWAEIFKIKVIEVLVFLYGKISIFAIE